MWNYIKQRKWQFYLAVLFIFLAQAALSGQAVVNQSLVDEVVAQNFEGVKKDALLLIGYTVFCVSLYAFSKVYQSIYADWLMNDIRSATFSGIMRQSRRDFFSCNSADYISALTNDIGTLRGFMNILYTAILCIASMIFHAVIMFYYQPVIAAFTVICAALITVVPLLLSKVVAKWQRNRSEALAQLNTRLAEFFSGFQVITSFGMKSRIKKQFEECSNTLKNCECHTDGLSSLSDGMGEFFSGLAQTMILILSCYMAITGRMTLGALVVFISLSGGFCAEFSMILQVIPMLRGMEPIINRIHGLESYEEKEENGTEPATFEKNIMVQNLNFGYNEQSPVLKGLSLELKHGKKYALIGESGSGKSTLIHLLTGSYMDYQGEICYDEIELHKIDRQNLYRTVSYIQQEVFLFDDTIQNNICLYEEFSDEQFRQAVALSGVDKFTDNLEGGVEYQVGERGARLSGGQRQRIAIARALIRNTKFLILDEGTSALDEKNAQEIESLLLNLPDLTLLTITHHLRNENEYDCVFEIENGKIK